MRSGKLVKILSMILGVLAIFIIGLQFYWTDYKTVQNYYNAIIEEDYSTAFEYLHIYDEYYDLGTKLTNKEAKEIYLRKAQELKKRNYRIVKVNNIRIAKVDGTKCADVNFTVQVSGITKNYSERVQIFSNRKIFIDYSGDGTKDLEMVNWGIRMIM